LLALVILEMVSQNLVIFGVHPNTALTNELLSWIVFVCPCLKTKDDLQFSCVHHSGH
jgi:uncharacterized membrane protein YfbV (UPF0208 family)